MVVWTHTINIEFNNTDNNQIKIKGCYRITLDKWVNYKLIKNYKVWKNLYQTKITTQTLMILFKILL